MSQLPPKPEPGETVKVDLDVLPEFLLAYDLRIREVTKGFVLILEKKKDEEL